MESANTTTPTTSASIGGSGSKTKCRALALSSTTAAKCSKAYSRSQSSTVSAPNFFTMAIATGGSIARASSRAKAGINGGTDHFMTDSSKQGTATGSGDGAQP